MPVKKTINIILLSILVFTCNFVGDIASLFNDTSLLAATETVEKEEKKENELKNYIETFERIKQSGQGGKNGFDDTSATYSPEFKKQTPTFFLATANPIIVSGYIVYETTVLLKNQNNEILNSLSSTPLYILYRCPKIYCA